MAGVVCPVLVARDLQFRALTAAVDAAMKGRGSIAFVTGEAGIGKSRLAQELLEQAKSGGSVSSLGRATPSRRTQPFGPLTEALIGVARRQPGDDTSDLGPWRIPLEGVLSPGGAAGAEAVPLVVRAESVVRFLARASEPHGLVLVLEDLHWADPDTIEIVEYLSDNLTGTRVLVIVTSRDSGAAQSMIERLEARRAGLHLRLQSLGDADVEKVVYACVPDADATTVRRVQSLADGVPFLIEELLAAPGVPATFTDSVRTRLADFDPDQRAVLSMAAVLGTVFDWRILERATSAPEDTVRTALDAGVRRQLLRVVDNEFAFQHTLTREALLELLLPTDRSALARLALAVLTEDSVDLSTRIDLALMAGDPAQAARWLVRAARTSLADGALATTIESLRHARKLGDGEAGPLLVEALALAGRVDDVVEVAAQVVAGSTLPESAARVRLSVTRAAITAERWSLAREALDAAHSDLAGGSTESLTAEAEVLEAEIALAGDDLVAANKHAEAALSLTAATPPVRCHALEVIGRISRFQDTARAESSFEGALRIANENNLPLWALRARHELGTIELFDHAGTRQLLAAHRTAIACGALGTAAVLDLQLAAVHQARFDLVAAEAHARSALELGDRLGLDPVRARALYSVAESRAAQGDRDEMERFVALTREAAPHDQTLVAFTIGGCHGFWELVHGDPTKAVSLFRRAAALLATQPHADPASFRALWTVLAASVGDPQAPSELASARRLGVGIVSVNSGLLSLAEANLAGRAGDPSRARELARDAEPRFVNCTAWADIARLLIAESAAKDAWDRPLWWISGLADRFEARGLAALAKRSRALTDGRGRWNGLDVTPREAEVLSLVVAGLSNKEIAARLAVSPRTVEKHLEAMLRKLGARSRTHLVALVEAWAASAAD